MPAHSFRLGGLVKDGSLQRNGKRLNFTITDGAQSIPVVYNGIPPDLFREGQGVIATGKMAEDMNTFRAHRLLARHDENYMPPEVNNALERAREKNNVNSTKQ
jgi:cytochrome c-type biogenesis protein CcmE